MVKALVFRGYKSAVNGCPPGEKVFWIPMSSWGLGNQHPLCLPWSSLIQIALAQSLSTYISFSNLCKSPGPKYLPRPTNANNGNHNAAAAQRPQACQRLPSGGWWQGTAMTLPAPPPLDHQPQRTTLGNAHGDEAHADDGSGARTPGSGERRALHTAARAPINLALKLLNTRTSKDALFNIGLEIVETWGPREHLYNHGLNYDAMYARVGAFLVYLSENFLKLYFSSSQKGSALFNPLEGIRCNPDMLQNWRPCDIGTLFLDRTVGHLLSGQPF